MLPVPTTCGTAPMKGPRVRQTLTSHEETLQEYSCHSNGAVDALPGATVDVATERLFQNSYKIGKMEINPCA